MHYSRPGRKSRRARESKERKSTKETTHFITATHSLGNQPSPSRKTPVTVKAGKVLKGPMYLQYRD